MTMPTPAFRALATALAAALALSIATAAPAAADDGAYAYAFAGTDTAVSPAAREALDANRVSYGGARADTLAIPDVNALRTACTSHYGEAGSPGDGWIRSRFEQCFTKPTGGIVVRTDNGQPAGEIRFNLWILGVASNGTREIQYHIFVDNITVSTIPGNVIDWPNQRVSLDFWNCPATPNLTCIADAHVPTVDGWYLDRGQVVKVTSPEGVGVGSDLTVAATLPVELTLGTEPIKPSKVGIFRSNLRFDSGRGLASNHGAVFPNFLSAFTLSMTDTQVKDSALHIYDAQNRPERTFPSWVGKSVPGKTATEPLHRLFDQTKKDSNRNASIAVCRDVWGDYSETGLDCDEYPFASTQEGAVTGTIDPARPRSSARLIPGDDNQLAGSRLGTFYSSNRILDTDAFIVTVLP